MVKSLLSILNVVEGEERPVLLVLGYGFFMGIFLAAYKVVATTLFLAKIK
jgi:AAA family ATP:ADP antiporter